MKRLCALLEDPALLHATQTFLYVCLSVCVSDFIQRQLVVCWSDDDALSTHCTAQLQLKSTLYDASSLPMCVNVLQTTAVVVLCIKQLICMSESVSVYVYKVYNTF